MTAPTVELTDRQKQVIGAIRDLTAEKGYPPTVREIGSAARYGCATAVKYQLEHLAEMGLVRWDAKIPRSIVLAGDIPLGEICWRCHGSGRTS